MQPAQRSRSDEPPVSDLQLPDPSSQGAPEGNAERRPRRLARYVAVGLLALLLTGGAFAWGWPLAPPLPAPSKPRPEMWKPTELRVAWLGHASVLIGFCGTTILTDPTFFDRIGLSLGPVTLGPKRLVAAALDPEELPPIDAVILSHAHLDSLDRPSLERVASAGTLIVPERTSDIVADLGFARVVELGWGKQIDVGEVRVEAVPVRHWGKRWPWERWRGYNGYLLTHGDQAILFAPDTAYTEQLGALAGRGVDVAVIGNGAYDPWVENHATPEQVWKMFGEMQARVLIPIHYDTFRLGIEPRGDAIRRLLAAAGDHSDQVVLRGIGATWKGVCAGDQVAATAAKPGEEGETSRVTP